MYTDGMNISCSYLLHSGVGILVVNMHDLLDIDEKTLDL